MKQLKRSECAVLPLVLKGKMKAGWRVVNPARWFDAVFNAFDEGVEGKMLDAVCESERAAIPFLDAIYLLKDWEKSKGAIRELKVALEHRLEIIVESDYTTSI